MLHVLHEKAFSMKVSSVMQQINFPNILSRNIKDSAPQNTQQLLFKLLA